MYVLLLGTLLQEYCLCIQFRELKSTQYKFCSQWDRFRSETEQRTGCSMFKTIKCLKAFYNILNMTIAQDWHRYGQPFWSVSVVVIVIRIHSLNSNLILINDHFFCLVEMQLLRHVPDYIVKTTLVHTTL